ncbi:MAG: hypothetical protein IT427_16700 [Pirellulales bacterium]|nr:hypothetical protein [Pirellulales bacterium]
MNNRIRSFSPLPETNTAGANGSRFELIEPPAPQRSGPTNVAQLYEIAFLHARALVEQQRWERLLQKIFEQGE